METTPRSQEQRLNEDPMRLLRAAIAFVARNVLFLVIGPLAGLLLGLLAQCLMTTVYEARATFIIDDLPFEQSGRGTDAETERTLVQTLILSIPSSDMLHAIEERSHAEPGKLSFIDIELPVSLKGSTPAANIHIEAKRNSRIGVIETTSQNPQFAATVANAILDELYRFNQLGGKLKSVTLTLNFAKLRADSLLKQLLDLSSERIKLERENSELEDYTRKGLALDGFPSFNTDATLSNLKTQLILVQSEYDSIASASTRGARLEGKRSELEGLKRQIEDHSKSLADALRSQYEIIRTEEDHVQQDLKVSQDRIQSLEQLAAHLTQSFGDPALMKTISASDLNGIADSADSSSNVIVVIDRAHPQKRPVSPKLWLNLLLGLVFGSAVGLAAAILYTWFDTRLTSVEAVERLTGLPCLAILPPLTPPTLSGGSAPHLQPHPQAVGIGFLRSRLLRNPRDVRSGRVIGFTPSAEGQECSQLVANLALLLARSDRKVLVVDLHLQAPRQAKMLGAAPSRGLGEWLVAEGPVAPFIAPSAHPDIGVLAPGHLPEQVDARLSSRPLAPALLELIGTWDFVLIDSPTILGDWGLMLSLPFGSPLVISAEYSASTSDHIRGVERRAQGPKWELLGVVLQNCPEKVARQHLG